MTLYTLLWIPSCLYLLKKSLQCYLYLLEPLWFPIVAPYMLASTMLAFFAKTILYNVSLFCRALVQQTLDKERSFVKCQGGHWVKVLSSSLSVVTVAFIWRVPVELNKVFIECPTKNTCQRSRCRCTVHRDLFAKSPTCRVFSKLCQVPEALNKAVVSANTRRNKHPLIYLKSLLAWIVHQAFSRRLYWYTIANRSR